MMAQIVRVFTLGVLAFLLADCSPNEEGPGRERISINDDWKFFKYNSPDKADQLIYHVRPEIRDPGEFMIADEKPTEAVRAEASASTLKAWIMPSGNTFLDDPASRYEIPAGNPGGDIPFVLAGLDEVPVRMWTFPMTGPLKGPFMKGGNPR
jgi:beta-galactosidase